MVVSQIYHIEYAHDSWDITLWYLVLDKYVYILFTYFLHEVKC